MSSAAQLFVLGTLLASGVSADLRMASQPRGGFRVRQRNPVQFVAKTALYMEPSDFQYNGLKQQRQNAYDNFLRSNIDNEQDKRNFVRESGRDMLPFRSFEAAALDTSGTVRNKIPDGAPGPVITATPGEPYIVPLRWNNPHASELEVNVWISNNAYVVPIRKPTCSGEGHQDNVFAFTIPADFNQLGSKVPGWTGCKKEGDCVLQIYAHSVEPRTYAIGTPLVVTGDVPAPTATSTLGIESARADVGLDLNKLPRDLCLSSAAAEADIPTAIPRAARLVSDQFNHAYQNSDYSPYSGQQPEAISRNLQASTIISMIPANQGELGGKLFKQQNKAGAALQGKLKAKVDKLVKAYEGVVNKIISRVGDKTMQNTAQLGAGGVQKLATTFRAAETGSVTTKRLKTNTYVPSFQLLTAQDVSAARALVPRQYRGLIDGQGQVRLYEAVLNDLKGDFQRAAARGLVFQPAMIKQTASTMEDVTGFRKVNAQGRKDGGIYAATQALQTKKAAAAALEMKQTFIIADVPSVVDAPLSSFSADDELPDTGADEVEMMPDTHGVNPDMDCDDDTLDLTTCTPPAGPLFVQSAEDPDEGLVLASTQNANSNSAMATATVANGIVLCIISTMGAFFTA